MLEPCEGKLSRTVLRGEGGSNTADLLDRPSDLTQRSGRIIRQGNFNPDVYLFRYVTKHTFDAYLWQTVENKQRYIGQILSEKEIPRRMEEDDMTLSFAEIKAVACGNPEIKRQMELTQEVKKLKMQKKYFFDQYCEMERYIKNIAPQRIESIKEQIDCVNEDLKLMENINFTNFHMKIFNYDYDEAKNATKHLRSIQGSFLSDREVGNYHGFRILIAKKRYYDDYRILLQGAETYEFFYNPESTNIAQKIIRTIKELPSEKERLQNYLDREERKYHTAKEALDPNFPFEQELKEKEQVLSDLNMKLSA